jgi:hypothetical protein
MADEQVAKEIENEVKAELQLLFPALRSFYGGNWQHMDAIRAHCGEFPNNWLELSNWPHFKILKKRYFAHTDGVTLPLEECFEGMSGAPTGPIMCDQQTSIVISNLSDSGVQFKAMLEQVFSCFGKITSVLFKEEIAGKFKALVKFEFANSARQALELNGINLGSSKIDIALGGESEHEFSETISSSPGMESGGGEVSMKSVKRSRWGAPAESDQVTSTQGKRRSRWGEGSALVSTSSTESNTKNTSVLHRLGLAKTLTQEEEQEAMMLKVRIQKAVEKCSPDQIMLDSLSLPDVPPIYDAVSGLRKNTPEARMREQRVIERDTLIEKMIALDPLYCPPAGYVRRKPTAKLYIPVKEYPSYNFIGLVIGPRGKTQKLMETESKCKICIRGRGSVKVGSRGLHADENDDLHVFISGATQADVDKAVAMVKPLLVPVNEDTNEHKQAQLRELALINGTVKADEYCPICGDQGHRHFECPTRTTHHVNKVRCTFCGETSHPSRDCPVERGRKQAAGEEADKVVLDEEYHSFMAEIENKQPSLPAPVVPTTTTMVTADEAQLAPEQGTTSDSSKAPDQASIENSSVQGVETVQEMKEGDGATGETIDPSHAQYYAYLQQQQMMYNYAAYGLQFDPVSQQWFYPYQQY